MSDNYFDRRIDSYIKDTKEFLQNNRGDEFNTEEDLERESIFLGILSACIDDCCGEL